MTCQQSLSLQSDVLGPSERYKIVQADAVAWLQSLPPASIDLVCCDPAYESLEKHRAKGTTTRLKVSEGSSNQWFPIFGNERFPALLAAVYRALKRDTHFYMMCDQETAFFAKPIAEAVGFKFWKAIIWDKCTIGMGYHYRSRHELVLFFEKGKRRLRDLGIADVLSIPRVRSVGCDCMGEIECDENEGREASTPRDTSNFQPATEDIRSPTSSSGSVTTDPSQQGCMSTIKTKTSRTTRSKTSSFSIPQPTSESTPDVSSETEFGGSHAESAELSSQSTLTTGTLRRTGAGQFSAAVGRATSRKSSSVNANGEHYCVRCNRPWPARSPFPTEKPVALSEILIGQSTEPGEIVADPFMGSGSVGVAALQQARRFTGCDIADDSILIAEPRLEDAAK